MPYFRSPRSDADRLDFMRKVLNASAQDSDAGHLYVSAETRTAVAALTPQMQAAFDAVATHSASRSQEIEERNEAYARLEMYTRDAFEMLRRQVRRLGLPAQIFQHVGLNLDGGSPLPPTPGAWVTIARALIAGEENAVAAGASPFCSPTAAEIQAVLDEVVKEETDVPAADRAFDEAQEALADLRQQADELVGEVMAELRYHLRKMDGPSQRRIMRTYGANFVYVPGEPPDVGDETLPA